MKLYATVASERATKAQGGNKFTECTLTVERVPVARMMLYDEGTLLDYELPNGERGTVEVPKQLPTIQ